jgi:hypothetical protein
VELRICIIVSDKVLPGLINKFIKWVGQQDDITIDNVTIVNEEIPIVDEDQYLPGILTRSFYKVIVWLETKLLIRTARYRDLLLGNDLLAVHPFLNVIELPSVPSLNIIRPDVVPHLVSHKVDSIINFTDCKISDEIISQIKFGAIPIGDSNWTRISNNLWKVAFWAVYRKKENTRFEILQHRLGTINPIVNGFIRTQFFFSLNRAALLEKEISYLKIILKAFSDDKTFIRLNDNSKPCEPEDSPGIFTFLIYYFQILKLVLTKVVRQFLGLGNRWGVAFVNTNWPDLNLSLGNQLKTRPGHYIADPFVISRLGSNYCFVEEYGYKEHKGWISVYEINGESSTYIGVALEENFHLSFPYLFEFEDVTYMCPETSNKSEIRVYQCDEFPLKWSLKSTLMEDVNAADTMLFEKSGKWWMFTNIDPVKGGDNCSELSIFYADSPLSNTWKAHAQNPVMIDSNKSRNGGVLKDGERIFRVGQAHGYDVYGKRTSLNEILMLDEYRYEERFIKNIEPVFFENLNGTHHMFSNNEVTVYDFVSVKNKWT